MNGGVDFTAEGADQSSWFFFATTYRIIWGLKSNSGNTLVDTMPMKADGLRMTTSEHDEAFAEQEQQSDESEPPRHVDYNADNLAPLRESCLLQHSLFTATRRGADLAGSSTAAAPTRRTWYSKRSQAERRWLCPSSAAWPRPASACIWAHCHLICKLRPGQRHALRSA